MSLQTSQRKPRRMNRKVSPYMLAISMILSANMAQAGENSDKKPTQLDKNIDIAQKAFDAGSFVKAERTWKRVQVELEKTPQDERLASVWLHLGDTYSKESKFADAESAFKHSMEVSRSLSKDTAEAQSKLDDLSKVYRPINLESFDDTATSFAKHVGALSASAFNKEENHHIEISLDKRFQQKIQDLLSSFMPKKADGTPQDVADLPAPAGAPQVKQLRLDKKIAFDLKKNDDGNFTLANIEGIFFDVGLWAKLKGLVMIPSHEQKPSVELTAGAFGVEKKVKTEIPKSFFDRLREGIDKFDPFGNAAIASGGTNSPATGTANSTSASSSSSSMDPSGANVPAATGTNSSVGASSPTVPSTDSSAPVNSSPANGAELQNNSRQESSSR